jgi:negative regulator of sigma E activity
MASKNRFLDNLTKAAAAASIFVAVVRFVNSFYYKNKAKNAGKNRFLKNLPKFTTAAVVVMSVVRFIKLFKDETEITPEQTNATLI